MRVRNQLAVVVATALTIPVFAEKYTLLTGVDANQQPGSVRMLLPVPGPGAPGFLADGDRLAGTVDVGGPATFLGVGTPMFDPNEFGSLSMLFRRGDIPPAFGGPMPLLAIDYMGGPLLDLDGDLNNGVRSLVPIVGRTPVTISDTTSFIDLDFDLAGGTVELVNFDATASNEAFPGFPAEIATVVITLAGTGPQGQPGAAINPAIDTRSGMVTRYTGTSGTLKRVWRIDDLGFELWQDAIDPNSSSPDFLGTLQYLGTLRGWLVQRNPLTGQFPPLAGQGLVGPDSTLWDAVETSEIGNSFNTPVNITGGVPATIAAGTALDDFTVAGNGGLPLTDFGGDLGAYLDAVVVPQLGPTAVRYVYLEAAGFGINNSFDPVFLDTVGYDVVIIAVAERQLSHGPLAKAVPASALPYP